MTTTANTDRRGSITAAVGIGAQVVILADFMEADEIVVHQVTNATGARTLLTAGVDYTFTLNSSPPSVGTLESLVTKTTATTWYWERVTDLDQQVDLTALGTFPPASVEQAFDKAILAVRDAEGLLETPNAGDMEGGVTLGTNWTETEGLRYYLHGGFVHIEGTVAKSAAITPNEILFTLASGYRPQKRMGFTILSIVTNWEVYGIEVHTDGTVRWAGNDLVTPTKVYLDGIYFRPA